MQIRLIHGPAVREIRNALGIPHGKFAIDCGITPGYLTKIEQGKQQPAEKVVTAIATRLGCSKDSITYTISSEATAA